MTSDLSGIARAEFLGGNVVHNGAQGARAELSRMRDRFLGGLYRLMDSPLGAVLGAMVYGLWAFFVNRHVGLPHAALIGLTHWMMSVIITMSCVVLMRTLFWLPSTPKRGACLSITGSLTLTYTLLISVHLFIGTPSILLTLAPGLAPTIGFAVTYSMLMYRENADIAWTLALKRCEPTALAPLGGPHARA